MAEEYDSDFLDESLFEEEFDNECDECGESLELCECDFEDDEE